MNKNNFYVTTPIYYGTAKPHLGSLYSTLIADVINRWQQMQGKQTFFLTGTDEHGQKIAQAAEKAGMTPKQFVDSFIEAYMETWNTYEIKYNHFIRTTDPYHIKGVQELILKLLDKGDIYKGRYEGWYCTPCETFVTHDLSLTKAPHCPTCNRETVKVQEETYFFKLSAYQQKLLDFYKKNPYFIIPKERSHEVISFVEAGLKDLSISRTTLTWGVPFPNDPEHVVYVWVDALCNYITAIGYGDKKKQKEFAQWWPANMQVLGKDIVRFHGVYWPAMLMAAGLELPQQLLVHGWIQINKQKMSKSFGNVIDPIELAKIYGIEPVRYYLMRHMPMNSDGDFSTQDLQQCITSDLANDLGNLLNRMTSLAEQHAMMMIEPPKKWSTKSLDIKDAALDLIEDYTRHMNDCEFHLALALVWKFIHQINRYFHDQEPWKVVKSNPDAFKEILATTCHGLYVVAMLLWSIMPSKMEELLASLGQSTKVSIDLLEQSIWEKKFNIKKVAPLFEKFEEKEKMVETTEQLKKEEYITIDDVMKVDIRVGTIIEAHDVEKSDRLIRMIVDLGHLGKRQILAGIRKSYSPESLVGKKGAFIVNLKPRPMMGMESQGMMLVASEEQRVSLISPDEDMPNGTRLK